MAMLEVKDLEVCYGVIQAIKGISFEVNQGEDHRPDRSQRRRKNHHPADHHRPDRRPKHGEHPLLMRGRDITKDPCPQDCVGMGMAHVPEGRRVFAELTVLQIT